MKKQTLTLLAFFGMVVIGGGNAVVAKIILNEITPIAYVFFRFLIASWLIILLWFKEKPKLDKNILKVLLVSLFSTINIFLFAYGIRLTTAISAQMIYSFVPIMTAIISYFLIKEKITYKKSLGILLCFIGTMIVVVLPKISQVSQSDNLTGNMLILLGAGLFAFYPVLSKKLQVDYSPLFLTVGFLTITALIGGIMFFLNGGNLKILSQMSSKALIALLYTSILGTGVFYLLTQQVIKYGSPLLAMLSLNLVPVSTILWAGILLGEKLSLGVLIGGSLALSGVFLIKQKN